MKLPPWQPKYYPQQPVMLRPEVMKWFEPKEAQNFATEWNVYLFQLKVDFVKYPRISVNSDQQENAYLVR